jgi:hypothetical protein
MRISDIIKEDGSVGGTGAASVATVAMPLFGDKKMIRRAVDPFGYLSGKKKPKVAENVITERSLADGGYGGWINARGGAVYPLEVNDSNHYDAARRLGVEMEDETDYMPAYKQHLVRYRTSDYPRQFALAGNYEDIKRTFNQWWPTAVKARRVYIDVIHRGVESGKGYEPVDPASRAAMRKDFGPVTEKPKVAEKVDSTVSNALPSLMDIGDNAGDLNKWSKAVAGHDGTKQTAPKTKSQGSFSDRGYAIGYSDVERKMASKAIGKTKTITSPGSKESSGTHKTSPINKDLR